MYDAGTAHTFASETSQFFSGMKTLAEIVSWNQAYVTKLVSWDVRFPRWPDPLAKACFVKIDGKSICSHLI